MIGYFSREVVSDFWSLRGDIVFEALWARQSPAAKIPFLAVHRPWKIANGFGSWKPKA
jgi:hypothetical protein